MLTSLLVELGLFNLQDDVRIGKEFFHVVNNSSTRILILLVDNVEELFANADVILKVKERCV